MPFYHRQQMQSYKGLLLQEVRQGYSYKLQDKIPCHVWQRELVREVSVTTIKKMVIIFHDRNNTGAVYPVQRSKEMPTWWEFVQYLLHKSRSYTFDMHWRPMYLFCTPCAFSFNHILKFENLKVSKNVATIRHEVITFGRRRRRNYGRWSSRERK